MARRATNKRTPEEPQRYCGDCDLGTWVDGHRNLDLNGKPICLTCPNREFHILRGAKACENGRKKRSETNMAFLSGLLLFSLGNFIVSMIIAPPEKKAGRVWFIRYTMLSFRLLIFCIVLYFILDSSGWK